MHRRAANLPLGWQIDLEDLGNEHGKPKIQPCNACVSSSMAFVRLALAIATARIAIISPTFCGTWTFYARLARADAWAFIGPINWYGHFELQAALRSACLHERRESSTRFDPQEEHRPGAGSRAFDPVARTLQEPSGGRTAAFFCFGDRGAADLDAEGRPKILAHKEWFDPKDEPYDKERNAYQSLVWQCRYSGVEVPDSLWSHADIGVGKLYADNQADALESEPAALAAFDEWARCFAQHVASEGIVEGADQAARGAKSTTQ
jgi:hypothetical protein